MELVSRDISMYSDVLDKEVIDILTNNNFIVWIAPVSAFYSFKDFKVAKGEEVTIPKEDYLKLIEASAIMSERLQELTERPDSQRLMEMLPSLQESNSFIHSKMPNVNIQTNTITENDIKALGSDIVNMVVREEDFMEFKSLTQPHKDTVQLTRENYANLTDNYKKSIAMEKALEEDIIVN